MQIVIDISEALYSSIKRGTENESAFYELKLVIENGTPLPKRHGRLIDADALEEDYDWCEYEGGSIVIGYQAYSTEQIDNAPTIIEATNNNNDYTWAKELIKRTGLSIAPEDGSKPYGYDCEDKVWRSDVIDLFGHGSTYTSEEAQKMIKNLPSAEVE